jgi:OOP family OmpA-OmpF porin
MKLTAMGAALGAIATAVAAAAPAQSGGVFIVFFDWAKPEINRDASAILDQVATHYRSNPAVNIGLTGHTDRSGAAAHNLRASRIRAEMVRDQLVKLGIPKSAMSVRGYGETWPVVRTEDGVREVQNRRVEIRFVAAR